MLVSQGGLWLAVKLGGTYRPVTVKSCVLILAVSFFSMLLVVLWWILFGKKGIGAYVIVVFLAAILADCFINPLVGDGLKYYRYPSLAAILMIEIAAVPIIFRDKSKIPNKKVQFSIRSAEGLFAVIALTLGIAMSIATPLSSYNTWDDSTHYQQSVHVSQGLYSSFTEADIDIIYSPDPILGIEARMEAAEKYNNEEENNSHVIVLSDPKALFVDRIGYLGSVVTRWFALLLKTDFSTRYLMGRIGNLLVYIAVMYFAIQRLNHGKTLLSVIALSPTVMFMASNYSYDPWVIAFFSLGFAYFFSALEDECIISTRDQTIMIVAFFLASLPKMPYCVLILLLLFLPKQSRKYYLAVCMCFFIVLVLMIGSTFLVGNVADPRAQGTVDAVLQIKYVFSHIPKAIKIVINNIIDLFSPKTTSYYLTCMGIIGMSKGNILLLGLILLAAISDCPRIAVKTRILGLLICAIQIAAMIMVLYMVFTPVGADSVIGFQPRYILPVLFAICAFVVGGWTEIKVKPWYFEMAAAAILIYSYTSVMIVPAI